MRTLIGIAGDKTTFKDQRPKGFSFYHVVTEIAMISFLAWFGMMWLAASLAVSAFLLEAARTKEPREKKKGAA